MSFFPEGDGVRGPHQGGKSRIGQMDRTHPSPQALLLSTCHSQNEHRLTLSALHLFLHVHLHLTLGFCKIAFVKRDRKSWAAGSYAQSPSMEMDVT